MGLVHIENAQWIKPGWYIGGGELEDTAQSRRNIEQSGSWDGPYATREEAQMVEDGEVEDRGECDCPGYAGPAPDGMDYSDWLAVNNID